jgi:hypothetical protein
VSLSLSGLATHTSLSIEFDLYVIQSWDGDGPEGGTPDVWTLAVSGGPVLLHTTFSNFTEMPGVPTRTQDYPGTYDDVPDGATNAAKTGAVESDTLGYFPGFLDFPGGDSVYHLSFGFLHSASSVTFSFTGSGNGFSGVGDESWGLDNVRVSDDNGVAPIPEPGTCVLLGAGLVALARRRRREA